MERGRNLSRGARVPWQAIAAGTAAVAFLGRFLRIQGLDGLVSIRGYDDGVYFAAALNLIHGRLPYADFLYLQPPGGFLALAPAAGLAPVLGDRTALVLARLGVMALGAVNTALVVAVARRWGPLAALTGGLLYAIAPIASAAEYVTLLEPFGTFALLAGVLLLERAARSTTPRGRAWLAVVAGAVLAWMPLAKIWGVVPLAIVVLWALVRFGWRDAVRVAGGATAMLVAAVAPFAVPARSAMLHQVVLDQLGRSRMPGSVLGRLQDVLGTSDSGLGRLASGPGGAFVAGAATVLVVAALVASGLSAWRARRGRVWVVLAAAQVVVLAAAPSYFPHYSAFAAPSLVVVVAAGVSTLRRPASRRVVAVAGVALGVVGSVTALALVTVGPFRPRPGGAFPESQVSALLPAGCVVADAPMPLILLDRYSAEITAGCDVPVDPSGQTYFVGAYDARGRAIPRIDNIIWQGDATAYLRSGAATLLSRPQGNQFTPETVTAIEDGRVVRHVGDITVITPTAKEPPWTDLHTDSGLVSPG